jgi:hypothetical protein
VTERPPTLTRTERRAPRIPSGGGRSATFSHMSDDRCGEVGDGGRCQFQAGHGGLHTLVWPSGDRMVLRTWSGPNDENDAALDYPYPAPVKALPWAPGCPKVDLPG